MTCVFMVVFYLFLGCDGQEICKCNLEVVMKNNREGIPLIVGEYESIDFNIVVNNTGTEPGYRAKLELTSNVDLPDHIIASGKDAVSFDRKVSCSR